MDRYRRERCCLPDGAANFIGYPLLCIGLFLGVPTSAFAESPASPSFEQDVRPILREYCLDCHGATDKLEGGLDLRLVRFMKTGGESGSAVTPGAPDDSLILSRVLSDEMPPGELKVNPEKKAVLRAWIAAGAPTLREEPETIGPGVPLTEAERAYWAYQPIRSPEILHPLDGDRIRTPLDALITQAMPKGLTLSQDAARETLIRRVYLDLTGLPPTPEQFQSWMSIPENGEPGKSDSTADWYSQLVDELLQSPHYGERWARHWLDAVGYADSDGATLADAERAWAWRYRDYVIRSFNEDKPFDRFLIEQLAGDELAGPQVGDWTPTQIECLTATGFLRMAADGTGSGENTPENRNKTIADTMQILGSTLLGSSLHCAQCHDHRYDPLSHKDYFAIRAVFEPALDWQNWKTPGERLVSLVTNAEREQSNQLEQSAQAIAAERSAKEAEYMKQALDQELTKYEEPLRQELRSAYETAADKRTDHQKMLLDKHPSVNISPGVLYQYLPAAAEDLKKYDARISEVRAKKPPETYLQALVEPAGHAPVTKLFHRGDFNQPTREIIPGKLAVLTPEGTSLDFPIDDPNLPTTGRRLAFARWLTQSNPPNPLLVRALVNRVWLHHFGKGIVATPGDFGRLGAAPTHPAVLDWLGSEWVASGWKLKTLHRMILLSTVYRQSSQRDPSKEAIDPDNRWYGRKPILRLDAEVLRDSILAFSGELSTDLFGPPVALQEDDAGQVRIDPAQPRRSLYARWRRTQPVAMLQSFDAPVMGVNCDIRSNSTVPTQSLMLMNGDFVLDQANKLASLAENSVSAPLSDSENSWKLPLPPTPQWHFGTGKLTQDSGIVTEFIPLPFYSGTQWQGSANVPDAQFGWVLLNANGGHPGNKEHPAIRRFFAPTSGKLQITGTLGHGSENGDGVQARVSNASAVLGKWTAKTGTTPTPVSEFAVNAGDAIDFVVDCIENESSDSFNWNINLTLTLPDGSNRTYDSLSGFRGPVDDYSRLRSHVVSAWKRILFRPPTEEEMQLVYRFAQQQIEVLHREPERVPSGSSVHHQVLANICQMLVSSNEFLYID